MHHEWIDKLLILLKWHCHPNESAPVTPTLPELCNNHVIMLRFVLEPLTKNYPNYPRLQTRCKVSLLLPTTCGQSLLRWNFLIVPRKKGGDHA